VKTVVKKFLGDNGRRQTAPNCLKKNGGPAPEACKGNCEANTKRKKKKATFVKTGQCTCDQKETRKGKTKSGRIVRKNLTSAALETPSYLERERGKLATMKITSIRRKRQKEGEEKRKGKETERQGGYGDEVRDCGQGKINQGNTNGKPDKTMG